MKYAHQLLASLAAFSLLFMVGCGGGDDSPTPGENGENPGAAIIGTWVQDEPGDVTGPAAESFTDFSITFTTTDTPSQVRYTTIGTEPLVFPAQGTFDIPESPNFQNGVQVTREDGVKVDIRLADENTLGMEFTVDSDSGIPTENSRVAEITGQYTFTLTKQQ